ncbi:MAG: metalloregulator ArsR/SmtB family transcription factor [Magnetococcales bacterium]|nr:metalloregulator ArsR/SmtB family transcription factor [Magnetococcales bacterium]
MSGSSFKTDLFNQFARVGKALSSAPRLEILEFLAQGERSVDALAKVSHLTVANTSRHLQVLSQAGLVSGRKAGRHAFYTLADESVVDLMTALRTMAERQLAEVDRLVRDYLSVRDNLEPIPRTELMRRLREGSVTVLDVRPPEEYQAGHLPEAHNIPLKQLEAQLENLPKEHEVVAYCRGPYCILAFEAVARLREKGFKARRLEDGLPEWKRAGLPLANG